MTTTSTRSTTSPTRRSCPTRTRTSTTCGAKDPVSCPINYGVARGHRAGRRPTTVYKDTENLLLVHRGGGPVHADAVHPRGRRHHARSSRSTAPRSRCTSTWSRWTRRGTPTRVAAQPAADAQTAQGERGLHVAAGRPPHSTSSSTTASASSSPPTQSRSRCWWSPTCSASRRRTTTDFRDVLRRPGGGHEHRRRSTMSRSPRTRWRGPTRSSPATSRTVASRPATTCSPRWPPRSIRTGRHRPWSTSCAPRRSCSRPGRRPPRSCSVAAIRVLGDRPDIQQQLRDDRSLIPVFVEEMPAHGQPGEERVPAGAQVARRSATPTCPRAPR